MDWNYEIPGKTLLDVAKICNAVVEDVVLQVQKNGILLTAVDASHVAMFAITIGEFDEKKEKLKFGVDLTKLIDIINGHTKATKSQTDIVQLEFNDTTKQMKVSAGDTSMRKYTTLDLETMTASPHIPDLRKSGMLEGDGICPKKFAAALKKQARFGDIASFVLNKDGLDITTDTVSSGLITSHLEASGVKSEAKSQYSLTYLKPFADRVKNAARMTIEIGENAPVVAKWQHEGINDNPGFEVKYFLAPRIESDY
tara:strand:- start:2146 stop:2910 length:765 start_codon:yes stop_codon:yes gene_type:complete